MKKLLLGFLVLFMAAAFTFAGGGKDVNQQTAAKQYTITVGGSTSAAPLMELFKAEYEKLHSNIKITISASGSGDGIKGVPDGTFEIGMSSRDLSPAEIGTGIDTLVCAIDGIALIVNNSNPISGLTQTQIKDIYTGNITRWEQLGAAANGKSGAIAVISRESGSGTRGAIEELLGFQDQLVKGAVEYDSTGAVKAEISRNIDAIGYLSLGSVDTDIKALNVDGVAASDPNVINGSYKIARPFILMTKKGVPVNAETQAFLDWIMSADGQAIVKTSWISVI